MKKTFIILALLFLVIACVGCDLSVIESSSAISSSATGIATNTTETTAETAISGERIYICGGEYGKYGKKIDLKTASGETVTKIEYAVPAGTYIVKNVGKYRTQINVYSEEKYTQDNNEYQSSPDGFKPILLDKDATATIEIPEGYLFYIVSEDKIELYKQ